MYTLGIDIGSASSKAVILKDGTDVVASAVVQVGTGTSGPGRVLEEVFSNVDLTQEDMDYTVATGYGRFFCRKCRQTAQRDYLPCKRDFSPCAICKNHH